MRFIFKKIQSVIIIPISMLLVQWAVKVIQSWKVHRLKEKDILGWRCGGLIPGNNR